MKKRAGLRSSAAISENDVIQEHNPSDDVVFLRDRIAELEKQLSEVEFL